MEKKKFAVPKDCKITGLTGFITTPAKWKDVKIDPPVEVRTIDHISVGIDPKTGVATVYLRRYRSKWWKIIGTNAKKP